MALAFYLACVNWLPLYDAVGVNAKLEVFENVTHFAQDSFCPLEHFRVKLNNKFHVTAKMARLCKLKSDEFKKNQYSTRFKEMKKLVAAEKKEAQRKKIEDWAKAEAQREKIEEARREAIEELREI